MKIYRRFDVVFNCSGPNPMRAMVAGVSGVLLGILISFPLKAQERLLSDIQKQWLQEHHRITVGVHGEGWPPFEEWNGANPRGLAIDHLNDIVMTHRFLLRSCG